MGASLSFNLRLKKFFLSCCTGSALRVTVCSDLEKDLPGLLDLSTCQVTFLCPLVLKEGGLGLSNHGIYEEYYLKIVLNPFGLCKRE